MFPDAARVFFQTSKYFVTQISYSVACTLINFTFHPLSAHSALWGGSSAVPVVSFWKSLDIEAAAYAARPSYVREVAEVGLVE